MEKSFESVRQELSRIAKYATKIHRPKQS